jgi:cytochrome P450
MLGNMALIKSPFCGRLLSSTPNARLPEMRRLGGQAIPKGDKVGLWYVSANRDVGAITQPNSFRVDRARRRAHLSYGASIHWCVGKRLADL